LTYSGKEKEEFRKTCPERLRTFRGGHREQRKKKKPTPIKKGKEEWPSENDRRVITKTTEPLDKSYNSEAEDHSSSLHEKGGRCRLHKAERKRKKAPCSGETI